MIKNVPYNFIIHPPHWDFFPFPFHPHCSSACRMKHLWLPSSIHSQVGREGAADPLPPVTTLAPSFFGSKCCLDFSILRRSFFTITPSCHSASPAGRTPPSGLFLVIFQTPFPLSTVSRTVAVFSTPITAPSPSSHHHSTIILCSKR